jgi:hypothetical protein
MNLYVNPSDANVMSPAIHIDISAIVSADGMGTKVARFILVEGSKRALSSELPPAFGLVARIAAVEIQERRAKR